jgi:hypothetical protein
MVESHKAVLRDLRDGFAESCATVQKPSLEHCRSAYDSSNFASNVFSENCAALPMHYLDRSYSVFARIPMRQ